MQRSLILGSGLLVALVTVPAISASPVPACDPSVAMTHIRGSSGAGQTGYRLTVKNLGSASCTFQNEPGLTLLGSHKRKLPTHVHWTGGPKIITFGPGKTVSARLRFSPDIPGPGEQRRGRCEPQAHSIRVQLVLQLKTLGREQLATGPVRPATSVCEHGRMTASPLR